MLIIGNVRPLLVSSHPKPSRDVDEKFLKQMRKLKCLCCGYPGPSDAHHIKSKGSGGGDDAWNVIPLCRGCHQEIHRVGFESFLDKYPHVLEHLEKLGWQYVGDRLRPPLL